MTAQEIPTKPLTQKLTVTLAGIAYRLALHWCTPLAAWIVDIADANGVPIVSGVPLVTGVDLLAQYGYLNFGGQLIAQTDNAKDAPPTYANLGSSGHLYFVTP
jgi:hypothetical protein